MSLAVVPTDEDRVARARETVARLLLVEAFELEVLSGMRQVAEDACEEAGWKPCEIDKERTRQLMGFALRLEVEKKTKDLRVIKAAFDKALAAAKVVGLDGPKGPVASAARHVEAECNSSLFPFEHEHQCPGCQRYFECEYTCSKRNKKFRIPPEGAFDAMYNSGWGGKQIGFEAFCPDCEDEE